jgi:hypothetical protein
MVNFLPDSDKRDDFIFANVECSHFDINKAIGPAYGVYISQLIRYSRACGLCLDKIYLKLDDHTCSC